MIDEVKRVSGRQLANPPPGTHTPDVSGDWRCSGKDHALPQGADESPKNTRLTVGYCLSNRKYQSASVILKMTVDQLEEALREIGEMAKAPKRASPAALSPTKIQGTTTR